MTSTDKRNPDYIWPGLAPYQESDDQLFFGRKEEIANLSRQVLTSNLTIVTGPSGAGKTSLLQAGIFPLLRKNGYYPVPVRFDFPQSQSLVRSAIDLIQDSLNRECGKHGLTLHRLNLDWIALRAEKLTFWEWLRTIELRGPDSQIIQPVFVFDQFEELFTLGRGIANLPWFIQEIGDALENFIPHPVTEYLNDTGADLPFEIQEQNYKSIISLRKDYFAHLMNLRNVLPAVTVRHNIFSLERFNERQAEQAVLGPAPEGLISREVAREIIQFISGSGEKDEAGSPDTERALPEQTEVEPAILSLVCQQLNHKRIELGLNAISGDFVRGSRGKILEEFFDNAMSQVQPETRIFIEDHLLDAEGFRTSAPENNFLLSNIPQQDIDYLINLRLLHRVDYYRRSHIELSHDVLTPVVKGSRALRVARQENERKKLVIAQLRKQRRRSMALTAGFALITIFALFSVRSAIQKQKAAQKMEKQSRFQYYISESTRLFETDLSESQAYRAAAMLEAADSFPAELVNLLAFQLNQPDKQYSIEKITQEYQKLVPFPDEGLILGITNNRCLHVIRNKSIIKDTLFDSSEGILMDIGISSEQKPILIFLKDEIRERKLVAKTYPGGIILDTLIANGSPNIVRNSDDGAFLVENYNYLDNRYILWLPEKKQHRNINRNSNRLRYISFENKKLVFIYEAPDSSWLVQTVDGETLDTINYTLKAFGQNMVNSRMFFENRVNPNVLFFNNNTISIHSLTGQKISSKTPLTCIDVYQKDKLICLLDENRDLLFDYDFQNNTCKKRIKTSRESLQIAYIDSLLAITSLAQSYEIYSVQNGKRLYTLNNPSNSFFRFSKINKNEYLVSHYSGNKQYHELMTFPVLESDKAILNNPKKLNIVSAGKVNNLSISASNFENGEKIKEFQSSDSLQVTIIPSHTGLFFGVMTMNIKNKYLSVEVYDSDKVIWNKKVNFEISKETLGNRTFDNYSAQFDLGFSGFSRDDHYLAINIYDSLSARCYVFNTVDRSIDSLTAPARIITDPNSGINYSASQLTGNSMKIEQFEQGDKLSFTQVDFPGYYRDFDISGDRIWVLSQDSLYIFNEQGKRLFSAYSNGIINLEIADKSQLAFGTNYNDILTVFNSSGQILITKNLSNRYYELDLFTDYLVQNNTLYLLKSGVAADSLKLPPASLKNEMAINLYSTILHSNHTFPKLPGKIIKELSWIELSNHSDRIELTDKEFGNLLANQQYSKNPTFILNISASHPRIDNSAAIDWFIQNQGVNRFKAAADNLILRGTSNNKLNSILKKYQFDDSTRLNFMLSIYHSRFQNNENNRKSNQGNIADLEKRDRQLLKYMEQIFKEARQSNIQFNEFGTLCWSYLLAGDKVNGLPYAEAEYKKDSANSPVATNLIHYLWYNGKTEEARKLLQSRKDKLQIINVGLLPDFEDMELYHSAKKGGFEKDMNALKAYCLAELEKLKKTKNR